MGSGVVLWGLMDAMAAHMSVGMKATERACMYEGYRGESSDSEHMS